MGTRSIIAAKVGDKWASIYCHWDGYLSNNGAILLHHYKDQAKIEKLIKLGDISSLGLEIGRKHDFDATCGSKKSSVLTDREFMSVCTAYGRDRGESDVDALYGDTLEAVLVDRGDEYQYFWDGKGWRWRRSPSGDEQTPWRYLIKQPEALFGR